MAAEVWQASGCLTAERFFWIVAMIGSSPVRVCHQCGPQNGQARLGCPTHVYSAASLCWSVLRLHRASAMIGCASIAWTNVPPTSNAVNRDTA